MRSVHSVNYHPPPWTGGKKKEKRGGEKGKRGKEKEEGENGSIHASSTVIGPSFLCL